MDGTLLNDRHEIHPEFWEIEEELLEKGILLAVASGRQYYNLESRFNRLNDRMIYFAENGTHVVHRSQDLFINDLDPEAAQKFIAVGRKIEGVQLVLCCKGAAYVESRDEAFISEIKQYYQRLEFVEDLTTIQDTILKVTIFDWKGVEKNSYPVFKEFEKDYKVAIAAKIFLDITNITANKGTAINKVQQQLGISPQETLVFGDYLNDLEMMQNAGTSFAMKNAHPEIIKISTHVTDFDNNENGVLETLKKLGLAGKIVPLPNR